MLSRPLSTVSSLAAKDVDSAKSLNRTKSDVAPRTSQVEVEVAGIYYSHLPFEIPGAVVLSTPSISTLQQTAKDVHLQINSDTSYANQFIIVLNLSPQVQELIAGDRNPLEVPYRLTLDAQHQKGVLRIMPSGAHERVTQSFTCELVEKLLDMGIRPRAYTLNAATRYHGNSCAKEADQSLTPSWDASSAQEWPSLVIETGLSESEAQLRADAYWWFANSDYKVNMVLLFHIRRSPERRVTIKLYSLRPTTPRMTRGLQAEAERTLLSNPTLSQTDSLIVLRHTAAHEIVITPSDVNAPLDSLIALHHSAVHEIVITSSDLNAPLVLDFASVMRRRPTPNTREKKKHYVHG
ncbi:hypothetical protein N7516_004132 [Penicillium verrucosum]|uniref:uncharacterized protein n=1 Tax=Penicillium verrucosum TaxID=60171 RepID=UPI0025454C3C|nr:uncharacterized protein N7516_004132 [Penicillium verrucosum]KAJ5943964.1 hypothetical protein N7516_004132 [Penicillium verrucosum]